MSDSEIIQHPGDFVLDGILIVGSSGLRLEIGNLLQELNIYQSLDSPYMSGSILLRMLLVSLKLYHFLVKKDYYFQFVLQAVGR